MGQTLILLTFDGYFCILDVCSFAENGYNNLKEIGVVKCLKRYMNSDTLISTGIAI